MDLHPRHLANQLSLLEYSYLCSVRPHQLFGHKGKKQAQPLEVVQKSNEVQNMSMFCLCVLCVLPLSFHVIMQYVSSYDVPCSLFAFRSVSVSYILCLGSRLDVLLSQSGIFIWLEISGSLCFRHVCKFCITHRWMPVAALLFSNAVIVLPNTASSTTIIIMRIITMLIRAILLVIISLEQAK